MQDRTKNLVFSSIIAFVSKGISFLVLLFSMPWTFNALGNIKFGILSVITSTFSILTFSDLGMGMGLQNILPGLIAKERHRAIAVYISTAFFYLVAVSFIIIIIGIILNITLDWSNILSISKNVSKKEFNNTILTFIIILSLGIPVSVVQKIQNSYQKSYITEIWIAIGNLFSLTSVFIVTTLKCSLPYFIISMQGIVYFSIGINFLLAIFLFKTFEFPKVKLFNKNVFFILSKIGLNYLILSVCNLLVNSIDSFLIAKLKGIEFVADYNVGFRLISILSMPIQIISLPFLVSYNDAWIRQDMNWLKKITLKYFLGISLFTLFASIAFFFVGNRILEIWIGHIKFSKYQLFCFSMFLIYLNFNYFISTLALTSRLVSKTVKIYPIGVILSLIGKILLLRYFATDFASIIWPTIFFMSLFFFLPIITIIFKFDYFKK